MGRNAKRTETVTIEEKLLIESVFDLDDKKASKFFKRLAGIDARIITRAIHFEPITPDDISKIRALLPHLTAFKNAREKLYWTKNDLITASETRAIYLFLEAFFFYEK